MDLNVRLEWFTGTEIFLAAEVSTFNTVLINVLLCFTHLTVQASDLGLLFIGDIKNLHSQGSALTNEYL